MEAPTELFLRLKDFGPPAVATDRAPPTCWSEELADHCEANDRFRHLVLKSSGTAGAINEATSLQRSKRIAEADCSCSATTTMQ